MPTFDQNVASWKALFGGSSQVSPVPALAKIAQSKIAAVEAALGLLQQQSAQSYNGVIAAHPEIYSAPNTVTFQVWQSLVAAASVAFGVFEKFQELQAFVTAEGEWEANNNGSLNPQPQPTFPADLATL